MVGMTMSVTISMSGMTLVALMGVAILISTLSLSTIPTLYIELIMTI